MFLYITVINISVLYVDGTELFDKFTKACDCGFVSSCDNFTIMYAIDEDFSAYYYKALSLSKKSCKLRDEGSCEGYKVVQE